jgi:hypothetical protein
MKRKSIEISKEDSLQIKIEYYLSTIYKYHIVVPLIVEIEEENDMVELDCWKLDIEKMKEDKVSYFVNLKASVDTEDLRQYDLRSEGHGRPAIRRIPFIKEILKNGDDLTISHLCHINWCVNPYHHVLESLEDNKGRNGCPGRSLCRHRIRCLRPGIYYLGESSISLSQNITTFLQNLSNE